MKKYLIRTVLVLAAITACNKEVETPVVDNGQEEVTPGMVTLTFKATIGEETRTVYANDKTASWVAGDKISVRVTDGTNFETAEFSTTDGETFTGQVQTGYTTIVSGIYPANDVYKGESMSTYFGNDGSVIGVNLPDTYDLDTANDTGRYIPMVGEMVHDNDNDTDTFTFHHICGALKIEVVDIFNALTFTTAGEAITGDFELDEETGRIKMPENGSSSTVTFNYGRLSTNPTVDERNNRTFYIPVPDGTLTAGATMALKNANKTSTFFDKTTSAAIEFNSNKIKRLPAINFNTPAGWGISVVEPEDVGKVRINYTLPTGTYYVRLLLKKSTFISDYEGSLAKFVEDRLPALTTFDYAKSTYYSTTGNIDTYYPEKDYISVIFGVIPANPSDLSDKTGRKITFEYCKLEYSFEEPTQEYLAWIGKWGLVDSNNKTDTWTIVRKQANHTYTVTGLCNNTSSPKKIEALFNNGNLKFMSQYDFATVKYSGDENVYYISLVGYNQNTSSVLYNAYEPYDLMEASFNQDGTASLIGAEHIYNNTTFAFSRYNLIRKTDHSASPAAYGSSRYLPATMTKQ